MAVAQAQNSTCNQCKNRLPLFRQEPAKPRRGRKALPSRSPQTPQKAPPYYFLDHDNFWKWRWRGRLWFFAGPTRTLPFGAALSHQTPWSTGSAGVRVHARQVSGAGSWGSWRLPGRRALKRDAETQWVGKAADMPADVAGVVSACLRRLLSTAVLCSTSSSRRLGPPSRDLIAHHARPGPQSLAETAVEPKRCAQDAIGCSPARSSGRSGVGSHQKWYPHS